MYLTYVSKGTSAVQDRDACQPLWGVPKHLLAEQMPATGYPQAYRTLDPDLFGDDLERPAPASVIRIAAAGLCVDRPVGPTSIAEPIAEP